MWSNIHKKLKDEDVIPTMDAEKAYKIGFEDGVRFIKELIDEMNALAAEGSSVRRS